MRGCLKFGICLAMGAATACEAPTTPAVDDASTVSTADPGFDGVAVDSSVEPDVVDPDGAIDPGLDTGTTDSAGQFDAGQFDAGEFDPGDPDAVMDAWPLIDGSVDSSVDPDAADTDRTIDSGLDGGTTDSAGELDAGDPDAAADPDAAIDTGPQPDSGSDGGVSPASLPCPPTGGVTFAEGIIELADLGHPAGITYAEVSGNRLLTRGYNLTGTTIRWILWDLDTGLQIASGPVFRGTVSPVPYLYLRGSSFVAFHGTTYKIFSASDGGLLTELTLPAPWLGGQYGLSTDGGYLWHANGSRLAVYSATGELLFERLGNYLYAPIFAAPTEVRIGAHMSILRISLDGTEAEIEHPGTGYFHSWFLDGERYFSNAGNFTWVHRLDGTTEELVELPLAYARLTGQGEYFTTLNSGGLKIYRVGHGSTPVYTEPYYSLDYIVARFGNHIATEAGTIIDLNTDGVAVRDVPISNEIAGDASGQWVLYDTTAPRWSRDGTGADLTTLGCGYTTIQASLNGPFALRSTDRVFLFDDFGSGPELWTELEGRSWVDIADDGNLMSVSTGFGAESETQILALPTLSVISTFVPGSFGGFHQDSLHVSLAGNVYDAVTMEEAPSLGGGHPRFSPSGSRQAELVAGAVKVFTGTTLTGIAPGSQFYGWMGDDHILTSSGLYDFGGVYQGYTGIAGTPISATHIFVPTAAAIYDVWTHDLVWSTSIAELATSDLAGGYAIIATGSKIVAEPLPPSILR